MGGHNKDVLAKLWPLNLGLSTLEKCELYVSINYKL